MRVRRSRRVPPYKWRDDNPYIPKGEVRYHWRTEIEIEVFEDAEIRQLDTNHHYPGQRFMLRVPMVDPETGGDRDVDGDAAVLRIEMVGASVDHIFDITRPTVRGFVSKAELEAEKEYRAGIAYGYAEYDADERYQLDTEYVIEEWQVLRDVD